MKTKATKIMAIIALVGIIIGAFGTGILAIYSIIAQDNPNTHITLPHQMNTAETKQISTENKTPEKTETVKKIETNTETATEK